MACFLGYLKLYFILILEYSKNILSLKNKMESEK